MIVEEDPFGTIARRLPPRLSSYVALGDSFTAGTGVPTAARWPDRLARGLALDNRRLVYRNLAVQGATSAEVLEQVGLAIQLEPDLVTVVCGANDVLASVRPDLDAFAARLELIFERLAAAMPGGLLMTATVPESWRFVAMGPRTRKRVVEGLRGVNARIRSIAKLLEVPYLEVTGHPALEDAESFCADGLHPSSLAHARVARAFEWLLYQQAEGRQLGKVGG